MTFSRLVAPRLRRRAVRIGARACRRAIPEPADHGRCADHRGHRHRYHGAPVCRQAVEAFGQQVVVANRAGAAGMIGAQAVVNAPADGYTVLFANSGHAILGAINKNMTFDPIGDFAGVSLVGEAPGIVVVPPSLGVSNLKEFVELAKAKPGTLNYGSAGIGTSTHLAGAYFALKTGIDIVHVPYTVSATIIADLLGGRIQASFVPLLSCCRCCRTAGSARWRSAPRSR